MQSRMEMIYIDSDNQARQTGIGAIFETNAETLAAFRSAKRCDVGHARADFLLDYYNRRGDLSDTIGLTRADFERISGERVLSEAEYREIDAAYWAGLGHNAHSTP
jgi:hypothetical protein